MFGTPLLRTLVYINVLDQERALNLLTTANHYGMNEVMTKEQKDIERDIIINNTTYDSEQKERILIIVSGR